VVRTTEASRDVEVYDTLVEMSEAAAREVVRLARHAVAERGRFVIALAGGETPRSLYALLARDHADGVPWESTHVCFGDERCVSPDDAASNYATARSSLLVHVRVAPEHVHRILGELGPERAASDYDARLRRLLHAEPLPSSFDVALLGVGPDGHTASLFPGDEALAERERWALPVLAPTSAGVRERVTLTLPLLNRSRVVLMLCAGAEKREIVSRVVAGAGSDLPAARVHGVERTVWLLDRPAAG
jgi:6-phosphogluconolactonase